MQLLDLSSEVVERILYFVVVTEGPEELAPLGKNAKLGIGSVLRTQPDLFMLRTCKALYSVGGRACYSGNKVCFSNRALACYLLHCFLGAIGPSNADMLHDVVVCCPDMVATYHDPEASGFSLPRFYRRQSDNAKSDFARGGWNIPGEKGRG